MSKIKYIIALFLCFTLAMNVNAQDKPGVTNVGATGKKVDPTYINEYGKLVCWPRVSPYGELLKYGPLVTTDSVNSITSTSANVYGNILHNGWCGDNTEQGFMYSTTDDFSSDVHYVTLSPVPTFKPCANPPACFCTDNSYNKELTGLTPGATYYYVAYATNACGTTYGDTLNFTTENSFVVTVTGDNVAYCYGGNSIKTYTASVPTTVPSPTYQWYVGGVAQSGATSNTFDYTFTSTASTSVAIKCEVTSGGVTKDDTKNVTVTVYSLPTVAISGDASLCYGEPTTLTASGASTYEWSWSGGSATTASITKNLTATTTYYVTGTDSHGCEGTSYKTVTVNHPTIAGTPSIAGDNVVCAGNTGVTLVASGVTATDGTLKYRWLKNDSPISGAIGASYATGTIAANTTYTCEFYALQDGCSSDTLALNHSVNVVTPVTGTLALSVVGGNTMCQGTDATINATVTGNDGVVTYAWSPGSQTGASYSITNITGTTTYTCTATVTKDGCTATTSKSVTVTVPTPTPGVITIIPEDAYVCYGGSTELTASAAGASGNLSYQWYKGTVSEANKLTGETYQKLTTENLTAAQLYSCVVTATADGTTCVSAPVTSSRTVSVYNPSLASVTVNGPSTVCAGVPATLTATPNGGSGCDSYSYQWYQGTTLLTGKTSSTYTTEPINATTTYYCQVKGLKGTDPVCQSEMKEGSISISLATSTLASATITANEATLCAGGSTTLSVSVGEHNGDLTYQWGTASGNISGATSSTYTTPELTNSTTYYCTVTNTTSGGCTVSRIPTQLVTVVKPSVGTLSLTGGTICYNTSKTLQAQATGNNGSLSYQWSTGGSNISGATSASYTTPSLTATTAYTVNVTATVSSPITCTATDSRTVTVTVAVPVYDTLEICACKLPHTFSYNGGTLTFTNAEMDLHSPRIDTLTKTYPIGSCPAAGHFTVVLWDPDNVVSSTSCSGVVFPNHTVSTNEVLSGNTLNAVEYNGYTYKVVQIGNQCWLKENLRTKLKPDGTTPIIAATSNSNATNTYYSFSGNISFQSGCKTETIDFAEYEKRFGLMYNWFTAMNSNNPDYGLTNYQGICPDGWHIPDTIEFQSMANYVGIVGEWSSPNWGVGDQISTGQHGVRLATGCEWKSSTVPTSPGDYAASDRNSSGFSARPSGCWNNAPAPGSWYTLGDWAFFWSSTRQQTGVSGGVAAYNFDLHPDWAGLSRDKNGDDQSIGRSIRCIRNEESVIGINSVTPGEAQAICTYQVAVAGQNGVCWSTSPNPTTADSHTNVAVAIGTHNATLSPLAENTLYYVRAYVMVDGNPVYSNQVTVTALSRPIVETMPVVAGTTTATLKGNVTSDGGYANTERGICWGTSANPTLSDNVLTDTGHGVGEYSLVASPLSNGVTYHCRAYARNDKGINYGEDVEFVVNTCTGTMSDTDPYTHTYPIGQLGSYCWMLRSMRSANLSNGTQVNYIIENVWDATAAVHTNTPTLYKTKSTRNNSGTGYIEFGIAHHDTYGYYYNYAAAKQICPTGWHLPTWTEWNDLEAWAISYFGCSGGAAQALASSDTWAYSGTSCHPGYEPSTTNNLSEFNAYPCGCVVNGMNNSFQQSVNFWVDAGADGNWVYLLYNNNALQKSTASGGNQHGMSVRCVRDH